MLKSYIYPNRNHKSFKKSSNDELLLNTCSLEHGNVKGAVAQKQRNGKKYMMEIHRCYNDLEMM